MLQARILRAGSEIRADAFKVRRGPAPARRAAAVAARHFSRKL